MERVAALVRQPVIAAGLGFVTNPSEATPPPAAPL